MLGTLGQAAAARRLPLANLACRATFAVLAAPFAATLADALPALPLPGPAAAIAGAHLAFNLALVAALSPFASPLMAAAARVVPDQPKPYDPFVAPRFLDDAALDAPPVALSNARSEAARMTEVLDRMLEIALNAIASREAEPLKALGELEARLSLFRSLVQAYLIEVRRRPLQAGDEAGVAEVLLFVSSLEHAGGIVAGPMRDRLRAVMKADVRFSERRTDVLARLFANVRAGLAQTVAVLASRDVDSACQLIQRNTGFRELEGEIICDELSGRGRVADHVGGLFIDIVRELHKVHTQAISIAYPIAENAGVLRISRPVARAQRAQRGMT